MSELILGDRDKDKDTKLGHEVVCFVGRCVSEMALVGISETISKGNEEK